MNKLFIVLFLILVANISHGQSSGFRLLCTEEFQIPMLIQERDSLLFIESNIEHKKSKRFKRITAYLDDADLLVELETAHQINEAFYEIKLHMITPYGIKIYPDRSDTEGSNSLTPGIINSIHWLDFAENFLIPGQQYFLIIESHLYSKAGVICEQGPPSKPLKNRLIRNLYLGSAVIGSGLLTAGLLQRERALSSYDDYVKSWRNGSSEGEAGTHFADADTQNRSFKGLSTSGGIVLGISGLLLLNNYRNYWRAKKTYDQSCCGTARLILQPEISPAFASADLTLGLSLKLVF